MTRGPAVTVAPSTTRESHSARRLLQLHARAPFRLDLTAWALRRRPQNEIDETGPHLKMSSQRLP